MEHDLLDLRARDDREARIAGPLALGEAAGAAIVVGDAPPAVLLALGASSSGLTLVGKRRRTKEAVRLLEAWTPVWTAEVTADQDAFPEIDDVHQRAVIWDLPKKDAAAALERALYAVADRGRVLLNVPRRGGVDHRLERLFKSLCGGEAARPEDAAPDRLTLWGVRRAPYPPEDREHEAAVLPISVIVVARGRPDRLEELLCDLLLRQHYPAQEVFVMDDAPGGSVPEDVFGLAARSPSRVVLVPTGGVGGARAVNDALGGVEGQFVAILDEEARVAPNALVCLGMLLESNPAHGAVVADAVTVHDDGTIGPVRPAPPFAPDRLLRSVLEGRYPARGAALFRRDQLRALEGMDPDLPCAHLVDLWFRLAAQGPVGTCPLPLVGVRADRRRPLPQDRTHAMQGVLRRLREDVSVARLAREFPEQPKEEREAWALTARADACARAELWEESLADLEACLAARPEFTEARDATFVCLRALGRSQEVLERVGETPSAADPVASLELASALGALERRPEALAVLDELIAAEPALEVAHLNRLALLLADAPATLVAAWEAYAAQRARDPSLRHARHLA